MSTTKLGSVLDNFGKQPKYIGFHFIEVAIVRSMGSGRRCTVPKESQRRHEDDREAKSHLESFHSLEWHVESHVSDGSTRCTLSLAEMHLLVIPSSLLLSWFNHPFWPLSQWQ